ncbi:chromate transporter [Thiobaca trueperi]|uniref:Chromate transporter n=1 Tax=Thiobaca trueperi TaxID=127458 RepID=A0A4R3N527_9GAMM|nr:chromate transporter [Thiobaca trueperi]TCT24290.1 chromate transporter [Thiobaca trueperi]
MNESARVTQPPSIGRIFRAFALIGISSFGGGLVAYLRDVVVDRERWLTDDEFLGALEIGQTLPGLNSTNVAVIVGRQLRGPRGALAAALGLILPGAVILSVLGVLYARLHDNPDVTAALAGVAAASVGLLLQVTLKIGGRQFLRPKDLMFILPTFLMVGVFHVSLVTTLLLLAPIAIWMNRPAALKKPPLSSSESRP